MVFHKNKVLLMDMLTKKMIGNPVNHRCSKGTDRKIVKNGSYVYHLDFKKYMIFKFDFDLKNNILHYENLDLTEKMMHIYPSQDDLYILIVLEDEKSTILLKNNEGGKE